MSHIICVDEPENFKTCYEASIDAKYRVQVRILTINLDQAIMKRDTEVVDIVHRNVMAEQTAMHHQLEQYTSDLHLHLRKIQLDAEMALHKASDILSLEHAADLKRVVQTQRCVVREYDIIQQEKKAVHREC